MVVSHLWTFMFDELHILFALRKWYCQPWDLKRFHDLDKYNIQISVQWVSDYTRLSIHFSPPQYAATFPIDLVRRRKQLEGAGGRARVYTTGLFGIFRQIIRNEGFRGLYRGILPEYYKVVPGVGICFMTYETLKKLLTDTTTSL